MLRNKLKVEKHIGSMCSEAIFFKKKTNSQKKTYGANLILSQKPKKRI